MKKLKFRYFCNNNNPKIKMNPSLFLTNYISQSIAGAILYFPFGFYLAPRCGYALSLVIGILFFLLQIRFCKWWLKNHKQGPLEGIWHRLTWLGSEKVK